MQHPVVYTAEYARAYQESLLQEARKLSGEPSLHSHRPGHRLLAGLGRALVAAGMALQQRYSQLEEQNHHRSNFPVRHAQ